MPILPGIGLRSFRSLSQDGRYCLVVKIIMLIFFIFVLRLSNQKQMHFLSPIGSLDSLESLTSLVGKLPFDLRRRWVERSVQIENLTRSLAKFTNFVEFVQAMSDEANSLFGLRSLNSAKPELNKPISRTKAASYNVSSNSSTIKKQDLNSKLKSGVCWFCDKASHKLVEWKDFLGITVKERFTFVKTNKLCHKCLSLKHRTPQSKRSNTCEVEGCTGKFHHTLLHYSNKSTKPKSSAYQNKGTSTSEMSSATSCPVVDQPAVNAETNVCLCVVLIIVQHDGKELATYAFLDQGSIHTFCDQSIVVVTGITCHYALLPPPCMH